MCYRTLQELDKAKRKKYAVTSLGNAELWKYTLSSVTKEFYFIFFPPFSLSPLISANILILLLLKGNSLSSSIFQKINFHCRSIDYSQPPLPSLLFFLIPSNIISSHLFLSNLFTSLLFLSNLFSSLYSYHFSLPPLLSNPSLRGIIPLQSYSPHNCFYFFLHFCSMFLFH